MQFIIQNLIDAYRLLYPDFSPLHPSTVHTRGKVIHRDFSPHGRPVAFRPRPTQRLHTLIGPQPPRAASEPTPGNPAFDEFTLGKSVGPLRADQRKSRVGRVGSGKKKKGGGYTKRMMMVMMMMEEGLCEKRRKIIIWNRKGRSPRDFLLANRSMVYCFTHEGSKNMKYVYGVLL